MIMKKLFLLLIAAAVGTLSGFAQNSLVATLQHGSNIQAFYGDDALSAAHTAAANGDIITLSTGEFNTGDITKAITLRGEGIGKTKLKSSNNSITFTIPHGSAYTLTLEGIEFTGNNITINGTDGTERAILSKILFHFWQTGMEINNCNATVIQSRMVYGRIIASENSVVTCLNSKLSDIGRSGNGHYDIQNCVVLNAYEITNSSIKNSIIDYAGGSWSLDASNTSSHCLVKNDVSGFANSYYVDSWEDVIVDNPYYEGEMAGSLYQLTETAAATYLGTDGTQVGIYGGTYPYNETVSYPLVKTLDVIGSHKNGKLNVKINVE